MMRAPKKLRNKYDKRYMEICWKDDGEGEARELTWKSDFPGVEAERGSLRGRGFEGVKMLIGGFGEGIGDKETGFHGFEFVVCSMKVQVCEG